MNVMFEYNRSIKDVVFGLGEANLKIKVLKKLNYKLIGHGQELLEGK